MESKVLWFLDELKELQELGSLSDEEMKILLARMSESWGKHADDTI